MRSSSPTLESWLARRTQAKTGEADPKSRRANSVPSRRPAAAEEDKAWDGLFDGAQFRELVRPDDDRRAWAEILEDEQAKEAEDEEEIFADLNDMEKRRLEGQ
jgi:hypothetical protein